MRCKCNGNKTALRAAQVRLRRDRQSINCTGRCVDCKPVPRPKASIPGQGNPGTTLLIVSEAVLDDVPVAMHAKLGAQLVPLQSQPLSSVLVGTQDNQPMRAVQLNAQQNGPKTRSKLQMLPESIVYHGVLMTPWEQGQHCLLQAHSSAHSPASAG